MMAQFDPKAFILIRVVYVFTYARHSCGGQKTTCGSSLNLLGPRDETQVLRLGGKYLYQLSHLPGPRKNFILNHYIRNNWNRFKLRYHLVNKYENKHRAWCMQLPGRLRTRMTNSTPTWVSEWVRKTLPQNTTYRGLGGTVQWYRICLVYTRL